MKYCNSIGKKKRCLFPLYFPRRWQRYPLLAPLLALRGAEEVALREAGEAAVAAWGRGLLPGLCHGLLMAAAAVAVAAAAALFDASAARKTLVKASASGSAPAAGGGKVGGGGGARAEKRDSRDPLALLLPLPAEGAAGAAAAAPVALGKGLRWWLAEVAVLETLPRRPRPKGVAAAVRSRLAMARGLAA